MSNPCKLTQDEVVTTDYTDSILCKACGYSIDAHRVAAPNQTPQSTFDERLDEILMDLLTKNYQTKRDEYGFDVIQNAEEAIEKSKAAITSLVLEDVVGEDLQ